MKKKILIITLLIVCLMPISIVYAGSLNEYENEVIAEAIKVYEYNGIQYKVNPTYIEQLRGYLASDGIDLTAEQSDEVIQTAYSSIQKGVEEGYMIPIETSDTQEDTQSGTDQQEEASENQDETDSNDIIPDQVDAENDANSINDSTASDHNNSDTSTDSSASVKVNSSDTSGNMDDATPEDFITDLLGDNESSASGPAASSNEATDIIKNTGFNLSNTIITIAGMGLLMLLGIIVTLRQNFFAHNDE